VVLLGKQHSSGHRGTQLTRYARDTGRPSAGDRTNDARTEDAPAAPSRWLGRRHLMAAYGAFGAYAVAAAFVSGGRDQVWAIWAACGYAVALAMLWCWRSRRGRMAAVGVSVALAVVAPLLWLSVAYPLEDGMVVIDRSAGLLLHHGLPYLAADQVTSWLSYNPYLPVMTLFGLPTAVAVASPVVGLNLAVITTDPPVLALILLALALAARPAASPEAGRTSWITAITCSGAALGAACDLKSTAWLAVPVLAAMVAARDGARAAGRFVAAVAVTAVVLIASFAPAALTSLRGANALVQNSVLFPLGLTHDKTPAESLLP